MKKMNEKTRKEKRIETKKTDVKTRRGKIREEKTNEDKRREVMTSNSICQIGCQGSGKNPHQVHGANFC